MAKSNSHKARLILKKTRYLIAAGYFILRIMLKCERKSSTNPYNSVHKGVIKREILI